MNVPCGQRRAPCFLAAAMLGKVGRFDLLLRLQAVDLYRRGCFRGSTWCAEALLDHRRPKGVFGRVPGSRDAR